MQVVLQTELFLLEEYADITLRRETAFVQELDAVIRLNFDAIINQDIIFDTFELSGLAYYAPSSNMLGQDPLNALRWGGVLEGASDPGTLIIPYYLQPEMKDWVQIEFLQVHALDWDTYERQQVQLAFDVIETYIDVQFVEVFSAEEAMFNLGVMSSLVFSFVLGRMVPPGEPDSPGFGFFNRRGTGWDRDGDGGLEIGGSAFEVIIHELGHGLGLAHPHDDGGTSTILQGVEDSGDTGDFDLNQSIFTIMSYNDGWDLGPAGTPDSQAYGFNASFGPLDIAVLQELYGANPTNGAGDTIYTLPENTGPGTYYSAIWDVGGTDTILASGASGAVIDLNAASLQYEDGGGGNVSYNNDVIGGYTIANGALIENAVGAEGADILTGNNQNNVLQGEGGADTLYGGGGADRLIGGMGDDELYGEAGADVFVLTPNGGIDRIHDFENGVDKIEIETGTAGFNGLGFKQDGNDVIMKSAAGLTRIMNIDVADLDITDFRLRQENAPVADLDKLPQNSFEQLMQLESPASEWALETEIDGHEPGYTEADFYV